MRSEHVLLRRKSPFFSWQLDHGAVMFERNGWVRPARYPAGAIAEHVMVRATGGILDAHSMGKLTVEGPGAAALLGLAATADVAGLAVGRARYTCLCAQDGGIIDDLIVYRTAESAFYLVTSTLCRGRVLDFLRGLAGEQLRLGQIQVQDVTAATGFIAVQGPFSRDLLLAAGVTVELVGQRLGYFGCAQGRVHDVPVLLARTGYTGELGYELSIPAEFAADIWDHLCRVGERMQVHPVGAEAMSSLRLEKGYRAYGADLDRAVNPLEAGLGWTVDWAKPDFCGREALLRIRQRGVSRRAVLLRARAGVVLRRGAKLSTGSGAPAGEVTSAAFGPSVDAYVGLGYLDATHPVPGTAFVEGGGVDCATRPFYDPAGRRVRS